MRKMGPIDFRILFAAALVLILMACGHQDKGSEAASSDSTMDSSAKPMSHEEREMQEMLQARSSKPQENPYKDAKIDIHVFKNDTIDQTPRLTGYGYDILIFGAVYNHQPHIPAINGMRGFNTKEQAQKAAELVVHKIRNNIMPPSLSPKELDSLGTLK